MRPRFDSPDDGTGVEIIDPIETHRYVLYTPEPVSLEPADTEAFAYPVSVARQFVASQITLPANPHVIILDANDGSHIADVNYGEVREPNSNWTDPEDLIDRKSVV